MGNCVASDRPASMKALRNQPSANTPDRTNLRSPSLNSSVLLPIIVQPPSFSAPGSPLSTPNSAPRHRSKSNNIAVRTPSSSGVSSASSSTASAVISRSASDTARFQYVVIFDYEARTKEDLTIRKSECLEIVDRKVAGWWMARNESGHEGWIPSNYVAKRGTLESEP